jgi:hypothetical protein
MRSRIVATVIGAAILIGGYAVIAGGGVTLYVSTSGSNTSNNCQNQGSPCQTLDYAYTQANPGDSIQLAAGSYGSFTVNYRSGMSGSPVTVNASGSVTFTDVNMEASNIIFDFTGTKFTAGNATARSFDVGGTGTRITDVIVDGISVDAQDTNNLDAMTVKNVTGITLRNSRVGNTMAGNGSSDTAKSIMTGASSSDYVANMVLEDNLFYDADTGTGSLAHLECIFATGVQGLTARRNRFEACTYFDIFITVQNVNGQSQPINHVIEDNVMGAPIAPDGTDFGYAINWHADVVNPNGFTIQRNSVEGAIATSFTGTPSSVSFDSNIVAKGIYTSEAGSQGCVANVTFNYNVMPNSCGTNTTTATESTIRSGWTAPASEDFSLTGSSVALGAANPTWATSTDYAGELRDGDPDAGALERSTGPTANVWVDDGTCDSTPTRQNPAVSFASAPAEAIACTLDQAQDVASGGDTIRIKNGTYGAQSITGSKASVVTYIGESKAGVIFTDSVNLETNITLQDVTVTNDSHGFEAIIPDSTTDTTLVNVDALGDYVSIEIYGVTRFQWIGGDFGDFDGSIQERRCDTDILPFRIGEDSVGPILIEGMHFSEMDAENTAGESGCPPGPSPPADNFHLETWRVDDGVDDVMFRNNIVDDCPGCNTAIVFISNHGDGMPEDLSFVGNMFGSGKVFKMEGAPCVNYLWAYNTIESTWSSISCTVYTNMRWVGNLVRHPGFGSPGAADAVWWENVWQAAADPGFNTGDDFGNEWVADDGGSSCNISNPCIDNLGFVSSTDLHITSSSPAVNSGETPGASDIATDTSIMGTTGDIDGDPRCIDAVCDAGADERDD